MNALWRKIKANWTRTDTLVSLTNTAALIAFVANCWWHSVAVCHLASALPIATQCMWAYRHRSVLREALVFGGLVALAWPIGEGLTAGAVGWWGEYLAPGLAIWHTPVYCSLIGWLASTHIFYFGRRTLEAGFSMAVAVANAMTTAFVVGVLGENLFVVADMWTYRPAALSLWYVPAFVPIGYALGYGILPLLRRTPIVITTLVWGAALCVACIGLGIATGFYR